MRQRSGAELRQESDRNSAPSAPLKPMEKKPPSGADSFHVLHKLPAGDSPYVRAKHVQLVDKDPIKAISLFWSAINSGDRVDSALKDMAIIMKQVDRAEEAVQAIKSFRHLCSSQAQESLDNVLIDLYKRCGRIDDEIELLQCKLKLIDEGRAFGGRKSKIARSHGKKFHVSIDHERARLFGNLAWAYIQKDDYHHAETLYRKALSIEPDKNKQCNLATCLMKTGRIAEARRLLQGIGPSAVVQNPSDTHVKSYERACEMLAEIEFQLALNVNEEREADMQISSSCNEVLNEIQNHVKEQIKTEIQQSCPSRNSCRPASVNETQNIGAAEVNRGGSTWRNGKKEPETLSLSLSSPAIKGSSKSPFSVGGDLNHEAEPLGCGGSRWGYDSDEEEFFTPASIKGDSNSPASVNRDKRLRAQFLGNGVEWGNHSDDLFLTPASGQKNSNSHNLGHRVRQNGDAPFHTRDNMYSHQHDSDQLLFMPVSIKGSSNSYFTARGIQRHGSQLFYTPPSGKGNSKLQIPFHGIQNHVAQPVGREDRWRNDDDELFFTPASAKKKPDSHAPINTIQNEGAEPHGRRNRWGNGSDEASSFSDKNTFSKEMCSWKNGERKGSIVDDSLNSNIPADIPTVNGNAVHSPASSQGSSKCKSQEPIKFSQSSTSKDRRKEAANVLSAGEPNGQLAPPSNVGNSKAESPRKLRYGLLPPVNENVKRRSETSVPGSRRWADMIEEDEGIPIGSPILVEEWLKGGCPKDKKKTWAEMVEEENAETQYSGLNASSDEKKWKPISKFSVCFGTIGDWSGSGDNDAFPDENFNTNLIWCSPRPNVQLSYQTGSLQQQKHNTIDQEGQPATPYSTTPNTDSDTADHKIGKHNGAPCSTGFQRNSSVRRSLSFGKRNLVINSLTESPKAVDKCDTSNLQAMGSGSTFGIDSKPKKRGNRLRVFQEITLPDTPRA